MYFQTSSTILAQSRINYGLATINGCRDRTWLISYFNTLMPRPSAWTKYFLSRTIFKLSRTKILSRVKKSIFCFEKSFKIKFLVKRTLKIYFQLEIFIMHGFWKQKIDFLTLDKIFVLDNFNRQMDKAIFSHSDYFL